MINSCLIPFINPSVDVYKIGNEQLEFYFMITRERVSVEVSLPVMSLVNDIDGKSSLNELCEKNFINYESENVQLFINYLYSKKIILIKSEEDQSNKLLSESELKRYDRQLSYFNSLTNISGSFAQKKLKNTKIVIFGVGAIGSGIAIQLAMLGICNLMVIDKGTVKSDSIQRHYFFKESDIGKKKVEVLSDYLKTINSNIICESIDQIIDFDTSVESFIKNADFVVNTLDEPYIGYTSIKIGRECFYKDIPLYVAGGFDAHLMSTGELIIPRKTPCVDCYSTHFSNSLKDWKPTYNVSAISNYKNFENTIFEVGGIASMSLFSISYAIIVITDYIITQDLSHIKGRGEFLFEGMNINYINVIKNPKCNICGIK